MAAAEKIEFTVKEGTNSNHSLTVYALSTCGFCKRGLAFLQDKSYAHRFVYVDLLPPELKTELKEELKQKYQKPLLFPFIVVDDKETYAGFDQDKWFRTFEVRMHYAEIDG